MAQRMLYQIFERRESEVHEQGHLCCFLVHLVPLEDLGEVKSDCGLVRLHGDTLIQQCPVLLHGPGHHNADSLNDVIVSVSGVELSALGYEEANIVLVSTCNSDC